MALNGHPGQALIAYYAEPGTPNTMRSHFSIARTQTTSASFKSDACTSDACPHCAPDRPSSAVTSYGLYGIAQRWTTSIIGHRRPLDPLVMRMSVRGVSTPRGGSMLHRHARTLWCPVPMRLHGPWPATRCVHTPSATTDQKVGARVLANARLNQILQTGKST
jgi:hypothetical protein